MKIIFTCRQVIPYLNLYMRIESLPFNRFSCANDVEYTGICVFKPLKLMQSIFKTYIFWLFFIKSTTSNHLDEISYVVSQSVLFS